MQQVLRWCLASTAVCQLSHGDNNNNDLPAVARLVQGQPCLFGKACPEHALQTSASTPSMPAVIVDRTYLNRLIFLKSNL